MLMSLVFGDATKVARWYIFKPKLPIWVNFGGSCNGRCLYTLWPFGIFYGHLVYFTAIWSTLKPFGIFCGHLVFFIAKWYFFLLWYFVERKIWQPWLRPLLFLLRRSISDGITFRSRSWLSEAGSSKKNSVPEPRYVQEPKLARFRAM
jgi:hypothetical protein